jgi:hypothetical protein
MSRYCKAASSRRRDAAKRLTPLDCCQCRDPYTCRCHDGPMSDRQAEAAAAALFHLERIGLSGLADPRTCKALWKAGFRTVAEDVNAKTQGLVA